MEIKTAIFYFFAFLLILAAARVVTARNPVHSVMYLVLNEDEYALLAGAVISFIAIAATMFATHRVDWSGAGTAGEGRIIAQGETA